MKKILLVLLMTVVFGQCFTQEESKYKSVVSATKMNVLYIGLDNPVEIAVAGIAADKLNVTINNGTIAKQETGRFIVKPQSAGLLTITVSAEIDGKMVAVGNHDFRVKRVPDPYPAIANMKGGIISKSLLLAQTGLIAYLENFDFDLSFSVTEYTISATINGYEESRTIKGAKITEDAKAMIEKLNLGDVVYFSDVKVIGPDGVIRNMGTIKFKLE